MRHRLPGAALALAGLLALAPACAKNGAGRTGATRPGRPGAPTAAPTVSLLADLQALPKSTFRVDYSISNNAPFTTLSVWWKNPKAKLATKYQGVDTEVYTDAAAATVTVCVRTGPRWACQSQQAATSVPVPTTLNPAQSAQLSQSLQVPGVTTSTRTIAGEQADCGAVPATQSTPAQDVCLAKSGAVLYFKGGSSTAQYTVEATSYTSSVSDGDLTPPA